MEFSHAFTGAFCSRDDNKCSVRRNNIPLYLVDRRELPVQGFSNLAVTLDVR